MIGLCCEFIVPITKLNGKTTYKNVMNVKNLQFSQFNNSKYTDQYILNTWISNINNLHQALYKHVVPFGIKVFRLSSNLFPLSDCKSELLKDNSLILAIRKLGKYCIDNNLRISSHPSQFVLLSSKKDDVIKKSIIELATQNYLFDVIGLEQSVKYPINIHGGVRGESEKLIVTINSLPDSIRSRLTLENDERSYSVKDLYNIYSKTNIPIVFDSHHASFNSLDLESDFNLAISTWGKYKPLTHLSNSEEGLGQTASFTDKRKHSDFVHYIPKYQLEANNSNQIDIDFEFKMKNIAIFKAVNDFGINYN